MFIVLNKDCTALLITFVSIDVSKYIILVLFFSGANIKILLLYSSNLF